MRMLSVSLLLCAVVALTAGMMMPCPSGWSEGGCNLCYRCYPQGKAWADAERYCLSQGGNLASIHSKDEHLFIRGLVKKATRKDASTWVGGYDAVQRNMWFWSDGTKFDYVEWAPANPSGGSQYCLALNYINHRWDDDYCYKRKPFCCSKDRAQIIPF